MFYHGSPSKTSALFALIGKAISSVSRARRVIQPILIAHAGSWKPAKTLSKEMNIAARYSPGKSRGALSLSKNQFPVPIIIARQKSFLC
jgi:hypothetical protein